jgi:hypothetical protein
VTWPIAGGLQTVRFNGTYDLAVTLRIFNSAGNYRTAAPYKAIISASARDWVVTHDTGYLPDIGSEREMTDWHTHT